MKISHGIEEDGVVVGNAYDKYGSENPLVKWIMDGFESTLAGFVSQVNPRTIHEVGCGEGYWVLDWLDKGVEARGSDFSETVISLAKSNAVTKGLNSSAFSVKSVYDLGKEDSADLIVCCEVLEHLDSPEAGLEALQRCTPHHLILSVPREPLWRVLNLARGKYICELGNTPGHVQHWSTNKFVGLVGRYFEVVEIQQPLPWTMLLCRQKQQPS